MKASTRETRQCPLSNSGSKSFTEKCSTGGQLSVTSDPRMSCPVICVSVAGTQVACCNNVRNVEINLLDLSLEAFQELLLAGVYISILHTAGILINMNSIFDISFCECDVSETECVLINTVLLLFWTLSALLRFITRYFGKWSCSKTNARPSQTPRRARGGSVNLGAPTSREY
jgi:hypothetical protein